MGEYRMGPIEVLVLEIQRPLGLFGLAETGSAGN
jgi:hypothetical protein